MILLDAQHSPNDYVPIVIQSIVVLGFVITTMIVSHILGPKRKTEAKLENFECGIEGMGNARSPFSVKYFLVAILFVLFDVEIIFMYPWAVNYRALGIFGFWEMLLFIVFLMLGFGYVLLRGALKWE